MTERASRKRRLGPYPASSSGPAASETRIVYGPSRGLLEGEVNVGKVIGIIAVLCALAA